LKKDILWPHLGSTQLHIPEEEHRCPDLSQKEMGAAPTKGGYHSGEFSEILVHYVGGEISAALMSQKSQSCGSDNMVLPSSMALRCFWDQLKNDRCNMGHVYLLEMRSKTARP